MKTNPNDFVEITARTGSGKDDGLTKLEHFSVLLMQAKLSASQGEKIASLYKDEVKLAAEHSVYEAMVLMDTLNEHYQRKENSVSNTYTLTGKEAESLIDILGIKNNLAPQVQTEQAIVEPSTEVPVT
jgi:hypothetical protein